MGPSSFQDDEVSLLRFLTDLQQTAHGPVPHPGDLVWWMYQSPLFKPETSIQLIRNNQQDIQAVVFSDPPEWASLTVHPDLQNPTAAIEAAEDHARQHGRQELTLRTGSGQPDFEELLLKRGYVPSPHKSALMEFVPLPQVPAPVLPEGYCLSNMQGLQDLPARVKVHQEVWNSRRFTLQALKNIQSHPLYDAGLDQVVVAPDGSLAAYALIWMESVHGTATFEPVGVHPLHQRKGLGKAVMLSGLRALQDRSATRITVSTRESNTPAVQLYESLGFKTTGHFLNYGRRFTD
ncbi:GNAT family N-acetyltransferase [Deinococcus cellulosilyticus]|uniref:N-acetyltransferase n=1 Tax=Deinococcus cellulosilyticus (strain DSM 18568 / NBRC 106333 / KACC 11606 / 5516J-15) TaxID=1223518 RepID=A0A511N6K7_DEIC1|nr:GNAT family N-acetyltransferase [Deinococcus cellulosilyticus]GEM48499.1 N-acetyltransferase [Deinococcus cellulosilyticus NBRC 106333 = KACC 11606]